MTRPLFDPKRMRQAPAPDAPPAPAAATGKPSATAPMTVSDLAARITRALDHIPQTIRVVGEVSGFSDRTHWYFALKDDSAVVNAVMFASSARRAGFTLKNGIQVVATGRIEFYKPQGKVTLIVERLEPVGAGARDLALRQLIEAVRALGWLDEARKRPLPTMPRRIGIITSRTGAALQDVLDTLRRRCCAVEVALIDVRVQGEAAAPEIARALRWAASARANLNLDTIILTRGGGSIEDLWAFNERIVAQAILDSPVPVCAAIGHETDVTLAELVADARAATPPHAAMRASPDAAAILEQLAAAQARLARVITRSLAAGARRLDHLQQRPALRDARGLIEPSATRARHAARALRSAIAARINTASGRIHQLDGRLARLQPAAAMARRHARLEDSERRLAGAIRHRLTPARLDTLDQRLTRAQSLPLERASARLKSAEGALRAISPLGVLARGYSVTTLEDGRLVRSPHEVRPGDTLRTRVQEGDIRSTVDGDAPARPASDSAHTAPPRRRSKRQPPPHPDQMDLFSPDRRETDRDS